MPLHRLPEHRSSHPYCGRGNAQLGGKILWQIAFLAVASRDAKTPRFITGKAKYLEDIQLPHMVHAAVLRSPYAHANIKGINTEKAASISGVIGVFTGKDFEEIPALPCAWQAGGVDNNANTPRVLEIDRVTFTGAGVAVVVAEDRYTAQDALAAIEVEYEPLPVVVNAEEATTRGSTTIARECSQQYLHGLGMW